MRWTWLLLAVVAAVVVAEDSDDVLELAEPCDPQTCVLPNCRCSTTAIPGNLAPRDTPQFVTVTFDDAVNIINIETYRNILYGRTNKNSCPAGATFYVSHEYTNYQLVNELYNNGFEIALHSISHRTPQNWWQEATVEDLTEEFADQKQQMQQFANIPATALNGIRKPFLQMSGNSSFQMMKQAGLTYDCSWPTISFVDPGLWPYTLDYASTQDCVIPPCPSASIPGPWVVPMLTWRDLDNLACSMADACFHIPPHDDEDAWFKFIVTNFERHYLGSRAPFGFFVHEWYINTHAGVRNAFIRFLDMINNLNDVFMVNTIDVVDWVKNPVPIDQYRNQPCKVPTPTQCFASSCGPLDAQHTDVQYWMTICGACPDKYPWVGNPLGL